jgi:hypothetical protein
VTKDVGRRQGTTGPLPRSAALLIGALAISLILGTGFLLINDRHADSPNLSGEPLTDAKAAEQVVDAARQIVTVAKLQQPAGGYRFVSCRNANEPPYQAAIYMSFRLPSANSVKYLGDVAAAMVAHGWTEASSVGEHFGRKLTKSGVTSIFYRNADDPDFATMRLYGECRNTTDHRNDNPVWTEVTAQLG